MKRLAILCICFVSSIALAGISRASLLPQKVVLDNGLVLITSEQNSLPIISFHLLVKAGSRYDPNGAEGLANLVSDLLTFGTTRKTAVEISEAVDFIGARLSTDASRDVATVSLSLLKKDLDKGLELLAEILTQANFPEEEVQRQKKSILASIKAKGERPRAIARDNFRAALFPNSPYGRTVEGTEKTVKKITRPELLKFYKAFYRPSRSILAVVGDVSQKELKEKLNRVFRSWEPSSFSQEPQAPASSSAAELIQINKDLTQANIIMGHQGIRRSHPDYYSVSVMAYILGGGGLSARLPDAIRNERGLAYSVRASFSAHKHQGTFQVSMQTKNESADEAMGVALDEIRRIRNDLVTEEELESAKTYLIGSFPLRLLTNQQIARFLAQVEYLNLGLDYPEHYPQLIRQVTQEDVRRVARAHLHPERLIIVMVANLEKVR
ncbi:MAG: hypothetical protein GTO40_26560 [Deltaproteobacteria bacterium]|nr:hypothetical protein [Deltaproteobacteria bacterium]